MDVEAEALVNFHQEALKYFDVQNYWQVHPPNLVTDYDLRGKDCDYLGLMIRLQEDTLDDPGLR